jgi:MYXO-CTERM domain-containing protein
LDTKLSIALLLGTLSLAHAAPPTSGKLDPKIFRAIDTGLIGIDHNVPVTPGVARVLISLRAPADAQALSSLESAGAKLTRVNGKILFHDRFVPARIDRPAALALAAMPEVVRVSLAVGRGPQPLDQSANLIRLADARGARPDLDLLTGKGIVIADVDTMVDPFHPTFFRGDGGYYDWIDTNGDGAFNPDTDAIDLDRDGKAAATEIASSITANTLNEYDQKVPARASGFDPGIDWLYLDLNGNHKRDYGSANGFTDKDPAFGEPLFVPDDVNRNGKLDVGERVVRLSTSKFRKIFANVGGQFPETDTWTRGTDLSTAQVDFSMGQLYGFADALHATGVNTILAGDVPLVGRRWVGMAPEAELVLAWDDASGLPMDGITFALDEKPDVILYELAPWCGAALDGSDPISEMVDASTTGDNITNTCPTGDEGSARKHAHAAVDPGQTTMLPFDLPAMARGRFSALNFVEVSVNVRGGIADKVTITDPGGTVYTIVNGAKGKLKSGAYFAATHEMSSRQTDFFDTYLYVNNTPPLDVGTWTVSVTAQSTAITVDAYVQDDQSSWAVGAAWDQSVATDASTVGFPSVADHCIAVNAQPDHLLTAQEPWFEVYFNLYFLPNNYAEAEQGQLRAYSPLGPRIDGVQKPDIVAPDNPWTATEHDTESKWPYGSMRVFGGTSGASPHVTGVAALLAQAGIKGDAARDAIRNGAVHDNLTGAVPNGNYGYGRLDAAGALGVSTVGKNFTVALTTSPAMPNAGDKVTLTAAPAGDPDAIASVSAKWDDGYDGSWDTPYDAAMQHQVSSMTAGKFPYKVRVRNAAGHVAEAIVWVTYGTPMMMPPPMMSSGCGCAVGARGAGGVIASLGMLGVALILFRKRIARRSA